MYTISILDKHITNGLICFKINEYEFQIRRTVNFIENELLKILTKLKKRLADKDTAGIAKILDDNKNINTTLFRFMEFLCPTEFENYCSYLCHYFFDDLKEPKISYRTIFRFMKTNDVKEALNGILTMRTDFINEIKTPKRVIQRHLDERFNKFIVACKNDDIESIRKLSPPLGDKSLIKRIYSTNEYIKVFESFVRRIGDRLIKEDQPLSKIEVARYIFKNTTKKSEVGDALTQIGRLNIFNEVASHVYSTLSSKPSSYRYEDDIWIIREKNLQGFGNHTLDFSPLSDIDKKHLKAHIHELIKKTAIKERALYTRVYAVTTIYNRFTELPYKDVYSIFDINYYHLLHLLDYLQQIKKVDGQDYYNLTSIYNLFQQTRLFFDWYIENIDSEQNNSFREIEMHNIKSFSESTDYMPEEVIGKLEEVIHELPEMYQNAWTIMMNTGLRFSDIQELSSECITYDEESQSYLFTYLNVKMENQRVQSGESKYHTIPVSHVVVEAVEKQKELTADLRIVADTDRIFITLNKHSKVVEFVGRPLARAINRLIKKHNIRDGNNELFHYTNHQCRKTIIVDLLSKGHSLRKVADYINHSEETSARYYRDLELKKIAELDSKLFQQLFEETIDKEIKNQYTEEEKKALFREIKLGARETPEGHGTCVKHVSFGPCHKKKCVGCKMLISGPQKLPKWYDLYREQQDFLKELEVEYKNSGIDNYQEHRVYQQELHLLKVYSETIKKMESFAKERGISIEQYKK
ncbi:hypothetical protein A361_10205 [Cytobacillus oceanisediminis 2691]|uniref:Tyr recombinase domain-containing protein n=1 Tax=Cytobacillus oceanisediminis 2691 TaxID=1196031 RepID=A0A160M9U9_9BACI|nr:site-specific integrase [Bacillus tuaregi]AND39487.1 hypothetical protein A361_10205 [Cytobacillus oceanisediminis 2691]